jgi:hypothetical protein
VLAPLLFNSSSARFWRLQRTGRWPTRLRGLSWLLAVKNSCLIEDRWSHEARLDERAELVVVTKLWCMLCAQVVVVQEQHSNGYEVRFQLAVLTSHEHSEAHELAVSEKADQTVDTGQVE